LGSNYNFEELIWSNQGLNFIIIEVWWPIRDLIETIWNTRTKPKKTLKSRDPITIYSGAWLQNCKTSNDQIGNIHFELKNGFVALTTIHCLLQQLFHVAGRETLQQQQWWSMCHSCHPSANRYQASRYWHKAVSNL